MQEQDEYAMTEKNLLKVCKERQMYQTPELNENCYFHCKGYRSIQNISRYNECRALWLQSNGLAKIENLDALVHLTCLYLQENCIADMENLNFPNLKQLNLSNNQISVIKNLDGCPELESLYLTVNRISKSADMMGLLGLSKLSVLDMARNQLEDEEFVNIVSQLPELKVLVLTGCPVTRTMKQYRKTVINACKQLTYLDERPVFEPERRTSEAFFRGGAEAEQNEHLLILCEKRAKDRSQFISMQAFLSGKPRDECLRLADEAYTSVIENFHKTGCLDLDEEHEHVNVQAYRGKRIWADEKVETVSREFLEGRVQVRIGIEADETDDDSIPELEEVKDDKEYINELNQALEYEAVFQTEIPEEVIETQNERDAKKVEKPESRAGQDIAPPRIIDCTDKTVEEVIGDIENEAVQVPIEMELAEKDDVHAEGDSDSMPD
ncbi:Leucine-rich_repeat protein [Hexamita inflata]|uniref:Leucine-rich repeat protein n=1 Tax=Hexamita inflata TaxID=28002 RepID=A0AA86NGY3_9EUKA|nr:Leucine-rich repeat protein [Hexamita inflata]